MGYVECVIGTGFSDNSLMVWGGVLLQPGNKVDV